MAVVARDLLVTGKTATSATVHANGRLTIDGEPFPWELGAPGPQVVHGKDQWTVVMVPVFVDGPVTVEPPGSVVKRRS